MLEGINTFSIYEILRRTIGWLNWKDSYGMTKEWLKVLDLIGAVVFWWDEKMLVELERFLRNDKSVVELWLDFCGMTKKRLRIRR